MTRDSERDLRLAGGRGPAAVAGGFKFQLEVRRQPYTAACTVTDLTGCHDLERAPAAAAGAAIGDVPSQ